MLQNKISEAVLKKSFNVINSFTIIKKLIVTFKNKDYLLQNNELIGQNFNLDFQAKLIALRLTL